MGDPVEIERTFVVADMPGLEDARREPVRQGYFTAPGDSVQVRLRRKADACRITVKSGSGVSRSEHEADLAPDQFDALWPATEGRRIEKTRWTGKLPDGLTFELDVFAGDLSPLRLVEVEFASRDAADAFNPPDWFGLEVTGDPAYTNQVLAARGAPPREITATQSEGSAWPTG